MLPSVRPKRFLVSAMISINNVNANITGKSRQSALVLISVALIAPVKPSTPSVLKTFEPIYSQSDN